MRITKLHIVLILLLVGAGFGGFKFWTMKQAEIKQREEKLKAEMVRQKQLEEDAAQKAAEAAAAATQETAAQQAPGTAAPVTYTVVSGDTLWSIAKKSEHFGQGHRWYDIWKANEDSILDFDRIESGQSLKIPLDKPEGYAWPPTDEDKKDRILNRSKLVRSESATN